MSTTDHLDDGEPSHHQSFVELGGDQDTPPERALDFSLMDRQSSNAYYDYASEKSLSHADSKLFYHQHQLEQHGSMEVASPSIITPQTAWPAASLGGVGGNLSRNQSLRSARSSNLSRSTENAAIL